jgi:hypothetical protein
MIRIIILFVVLLSGRLVSAQDISVSTLRWSATGFKDLDSGGDFSNGCEFITYGTGRIKWIQDNGKEVLEWTVSETVGSWADVKTTGSYQYLFSDGALSGEITISKGAGGWLVDLVLVGGTSDIKLRYVITSVEKL